MEDVTVYDELKATVEEIMFKESGFWHCTMCDKSNYKKSNIKSHIETNHMNKSFPCKFCEVIFKNRQALRMHEVRAKHY